MCGCKSGLKGGKKARVSSGTRPTGMQTVKTTKVIKKK